MTGVIDARSENTFILPQHDFRLQKRTSVYGE